MRRGDTYNPQRQMNPRGIAIVIILELLIL